MLTAKFDLFTVVMAEAHEDAKRPKEVIGFSVSCTVSNWPNTNPITANIYFTVSGAEAHRDAKKAN